MPFFLRPELPLVQDSNELIHDSEFNCDEFKYLTAFRARSWYRGMVGTSDLVEIVDNCRAIDEAFAIREFENWDAGDWIDTGDVSLPIVEGDDIFMLVIEPVKPHGDRDAPHIR